MTDHPIRGSIRAVLARLALALVVAGLAPQGMAQEAAPRVLRIATGGATGVYFPTGNAICRAVTMTRKDHGLQCAAETSGGSAANLAALRAGETDFALVQSNSEADAVAGRGAFAAAGPDTGLRAVFSLFPEPVHLIVRSHAGIAGPADLAGKRVNLGAEGSGSRGLAEAWLAAAGIDPKSFAELQSLDPGAQATALCEGTVDASFWVAGVPNGEAMAAATDCEVTMLPLAGPAVDKVLAANPAFTAAVIPGLIYPGTDADVPSWGPRALLVTSDKVPDDEVYVLVKSVFDGFKDFRRLHPALFRLTEQPMVTGELGAPLHPGALRYYRERGWR